MSSLRIRIIIAVPVLLFSLCLTGLFHRALAETQYVSDMLIISVREGQDPEDPVLGYLRSGTPLDILEETDAFMNIRTQDGLQGWVRKKFIVADKPKAIIIDDLRTQIARLETDMQSLQEASDTQGLKKIMQGYQKEIQSLNTALKNEKNALSTLQKKSKQVNLKHQQLLNKQKKDAANDKELASLKNANIALKKKLASQPSATPTPMLTGNMKWFLIGGGVLIFGFLIGRSVNRTKTYRY